MMIITRTSVCLVLAVGLSAAAGGDRQEPSGAERALIEARHDVTAGVLRLKIAADTTPGCAEARAALILAERYGVETDTVADETMAPRDLAAYVSTYNDRAREAINKRHGRSTCEAVAVEARMLCAIEAADPDARRPFVRAGIADAKRDLADDRLRMLRVGPVSGIPAAREELLERELGVRALMLSERSAPIFRYVRGYNKKVEQHLTARHGAQRFRDLDARAAALAAERDIEQGRLVVVSYGMPGSWQLVHQELLEQRFGIELRFGGCILPERDDGPYRRRMQAEIDRRFGIGVVEQTAEEARRLDRRRRDDGFESGRGDEQDILTLPGS